MKKILYILSTISISNIISTNIIACNKKINDNKPIESKFINEQPTENSNWKLIDIKWQKDSDKFENEFKKKNDKWYFFIESDTYGFNKYLVKNNGNDIKQVDDWLWIIALKNKGYAYFDASKLKSIYCWNGINEPIIPTINKNNGEIINWNEKIES